MAYIKHLSTLLSVVMLAIIINICAAYFANNNKSVNADFREASTIQNQTQSPSAKTVNTPTVNVTARLAALGIKLRPGTDHRSDSKPTTQSSTWCKSLVYKTLMALPPNHRNQLDELTLFYTNDGRRGLGGNGEIILRCKNVTDSELVSVFVHEIGHIVDSGYLVGYAPQDETDFSGFYDFGEPVGDSDPSAEFYKISWQNEKEMKSDAQDVDFVSLYGKTDPFEDFAETYTYYRLHGAEFRKLLSTSDYLKQKYSFFKYKVFDGEEFGESENPGKLNIWTRNYDVTVLPFIIKKFLG